MLETSPIEGELVTPEFDEAHEGESSKGEEEGQKDRSKKSINHNARIFSAATLLQLKSGAKVDTKKALLKWSAKTLRILQFLCEINADSLRAMLKFCVIYSALLDKNRWQRVRILTESYSILSLFVHQKRTGLY